MRSIESNKKDFEDSEEWEDSEGWESDVYIPQSP